MSAAASITLWGRANSINVQKVVWTLEELGCAYERIDAGGAFGGTDTADFRSMNPGGLVPALRDGDFGLFESNSICRYLCDAKGGAALFPASLQARYVCESWMDWQASLFWPAMRGAFMQTVRTAAADRDEGVIAASVAQSETLLAAMERRLSDSAYLGGAAFTLADIPAALTLNRWYQLDVATRRFAQVEAYFERLQQRAPFANIIAAPLS